MKILRFEAGGETRYGILENGDLVSELVGSPFGSFHAGGPVGKLSEVPLLAPVVPDKIICVGLNYRSHIEEMGFATPERPMLFMKPRTTLTNPGDPVIYPRQGTQVEYEGELVPVIGKSARHVPEEDALDYVLGYMCGNDMTERALQHAELVNRSMLISKGFDTFCPLGPVIETDLDPTNVDLTTRLNGEVKQQSNTSDLLFSVAQLVVRNVCNDWLIGTGAFPAMPGFWRQPLGSPAFHPSFQGCWSTSLLHQSGGHARARRRHHDGHAVRRGACIPRRRRGGRDVWDRRPAEPDRGRGVTPARPILGVRGIDIQHARVVC